MTRRSAIALAALAICMNGSLHAAETELYETGPAEDSSFVRFVNAGNMPINVSATGTRKTLTLNNEYRVSNYLPVRAERLIKGTMSHGSAQADVELQVKPGQFATVVAMPGGTDVLETVVMHEDPEDFNSQKASVAFYNLDASCIDAALQVDGRPVFLFKEQPVGVVARRMINPVNLTLRVVCGGSFSGPVLNLKTLQPGERYSIFLVASGAGRESFFVVDKLAR